MVKTVKVTIISFILAAVCWVTEIVASPSGFEIILAAADLCVGIFTAVFVLLLADFILWRLKRRKA